MPKCKIHPRYRAARPPRSTANGCTCQQVWEAAEEARLAAIPAEGQE